MRSVKTTIRLMVVMLLGIVSNAVAEDTYWVGTTGDWFSPANWQYKVPETDDEAYIDNGGTAEITAGSAQVDGLHLGETSGASGNVNHFSKSLIRLFSMNYSPLES